MKYFEKVPAILLLEDGTIYHGRSAGKIGSATGEICFNTGMTGYIEVFSDPSYYGQILVMTNVHIGNYGATYDELESDSLKINGLVCRKFTNVYSRHAADMSIQEFFLDQGMVGISDIDTRSLVRHIRDKGAMNAIISSEETDPDKLKKELDKVPNMGGLELASKVSTKEPYEMGDPAASYRVAVLDLGVKKAILNNLIQRGCYVKVFPAKTSYEEMEEWNPDGYFFSNGPGDPGAMEYATATLKKVLDADRPFFGICLGHQIFASALGFPTYKMHHGHRGLNHPVKNMITGQSGITTQNHGFAVEGESVKQSKEVEITHVNLNDDSVEGMRHVSKKAFSVQYHPEASPGPHDSYYLFDNFVELIQSDKEKHKIEVK